MEPGLLTPLPQEGWTARIRSLQLDGARADYVELDPYRFDVPPLEDRPDGPVQVWLVVVVTGTAIGTVDGDEVTISPRRAVLLDGRSPMTFHVAEPLRAFRLFADEHRLPAEVLERWTRPYAFLKPGPLVTGCIGLISGLLQVGNPVVDPGDQGAVGQPLIALQASLLDEALHQQEDDRRSPSGPSSRRGRIEAHIEQHLHDPDLTVASLAAALDVTVRTVHAAYEGSGQTVAAEIRARRVSRAQTLLAVRHEPPNVGAVAARVGLSRDQLARAFREATGRTALQWWEEHRAGAR